MPRVRQDDLTQKRRGALPRRRGRLRPWRFLAVVLVLLVLGGSLWATAYALSMQARVAALPTLVRARLRAHGDGAYVPYDRLPPFLVQALVATEDRTFWTNSGISFRGIARAAIVDAIHLSFLEGASTIQQQIARDIYLTPRKTIVRKLEGTVLALVITHDFPRREILALYLNEVYLGQNAYGVARAARIYFGVSPEALTPAQCAVLAGLPQAPSAYDPLTDLDGAKARQQAVLASMVAVGDITKARARALARAPLGLAH